MKIKKDTVASFRYIMRNGKKEVLEDTMAGTATTYLHGSGGIQSYLQRQLKGLAAGNKKIIHLSKGRQSTEDDFTFEVIIDEVRNALPEELVLGYPVLLPDKKCEEDCVCYKKVLC